MVVGESAIATTSAEAQPLDRRRPFLYAMGSRQTKSHQVRVEKRQTNFQRRTLKTQIVRIMANVNHILHEEFGSKRFCIMRKGNERSTQGGECPPLDITKHIGSIEQLLLCFGQ